MSPVGPGSRLKQNPDVVARELAAGEGAVLLHLKTGAYHGMNRVGLAVWELLDGERTVEDVMEAVRTRVDGAPQSLEADVTAFLNGALERDLVAIVRQDDEGSIERRGGAG